MTSRWSADDHQLGFGVNVAYWKSSQTSHARSGGSWMFNGQTTGAGWRTSCSGASRSVEHGVPNLLMDMCTRALRAGRVADERAASRSTAACAGSRSSASRCSYERRHLNFNHDNFRNNVRSTVFLNAPAGLHLPGRRGFPDGKTG